MNEYDVESHKKSGVAIKSLDHTIPIYIFAKGEGKMGNNINMESYNNNNSNDITRLNVPHKTWGSNALKAPCLSNAENIRTFF